MIELSTGYLNNEQLDAEVLAIADDFRAAGLRTVYVTFGIFCWRDSLVQWTEIPVSTSELPAFLDEFEADGTFELGESDVHLRGGSVDFLLCHEHDVHCSGEDSPLLQAVRKRWTREYEFSVERRSGGRWRRLTGRPRDTRDVRR